MFDKDGLYFLPLGGADEIGLNCYVYACRGKLIVVDCGYGFLNDEHPGIDLSLADASFLEGFQDRIEGLFITHAHEDHFGAIAHIWPHLRCPVYATDLTCGLIRHRLEEWGMAKEVKLNPVQALGKKVKLPTFEVEYAFVSHNVPETAALIIRTPEGIAVHATDFRFDDGKMALLPTDFPALEQAGRDGVDLFVCDSTNVLVDVEQPNESEVRDCLLEMIPTIPNAVLATCFSSNLTRLETLIMAAEKAGRTPVLVGRSLISFHNIALKCGYFKERARCLDIKEAKDIPSDKALYISTGSQANYRSALTLIANGELRDVKLGVGDTAIFSSRVIPGNEKAIERMQDKLADMGVEIVTRDEACVHTTGHPNKSDLKKMYGILKPAVAIPVHGDKRFVKAHKAFALACGIGNVTTSRNGMIWRIAGGRVERAGEVPTDVLGVDRREVVSLGSQVVKNRVRLKYNCSVFISAVFTAEWELKDLRITSIDIAEEKRFAKIAEEAKEKVIAGLPLAMERAKYQEHLIADYIRGKVRKHIENRTEIKPVTFMHLYKV